MNALRLLLVVLWLVLAVHTGIVGLRHGWNLLPVFFRDIAAFGWPGQFDLDFLCFLVLSGLWTSWRHRFTAGGLGLFLRGDVLSRGIEEYAVFVVFHAMTTA